MEQPKLSTPTFLPQIPDEKRLYDAALGARWDERIDILSSNPNVRSDYRHGSDGVTALHVVCIYGGSVEVCELMLQRESCNINATTNDGYTPLDYAILNNHKELVTLLVSKNAVANYTQNEDGEWKYTG